MDKNNELANILRAELTLLTKDILQNIHQKDLKSLYKATRQLHEKMAAIMVLKDQLDTSELIKILKMRKAETGEDAALSVETIQKTVAPKEKEDVKKTFNERGVTGNIKKEESSNSVQQGQQKQEVNPYKQAGKMRFVPKGQKAPIQPAQSSGPSKPVGHQRKMNIGLNDKISFIKHLFDGNHADYSRFIEYINTFDDYEAALQYVNQEIKPQYNNWEGKDEYEFRLLQLLELKFA